MVVFGSVASRLIVTLSEAVPPSEVAEQPKVSPDVSEVTLLVPHPDVMVAVESGLFTNHSTLTLEVYQPLVPSVPVMVRVISGAVESVGASILTVTVPLSWRDGSPALPPYSTT